MTDAGPPPYPAPPSNDFGPPPPFGSPAPGSPRRRSMVWRHIVGPLVALLATPVGFALIDYGATRYIQDVYRYADPGWSAELLWLVAGGLALTVAAASARLSGLGPILAFLVWALAPFLWFLSDGAGFYEFSRDLPSTHFWFSYAPLEFPLLGALLLGAGLGGRWRGRVVAS